MLQSISLLIAAGNALALPSVLLSSLHPISRTGYGGQVQLLVAELKRSWHVQLLAWNVKYRGEGPAEDLEALLKRKGFAQPDLLAQAGGDPRALLPGVPIVTSRIAPPTGYEEGAGWWELSRAMELFTEASLCPGTSGTCPFRKPDVILHLHDAWWLGPGPGQVKEAMRVGHLPPLISWLPILFDPLLSSDPERPDRSGLALQLFSGVITMSLWGRGVYETALATSATSAASASLPPLLGHVPHALHPAFAEGPLAFEAAARAEARRGLGLPRDAFVVLLVGRNPPPPSFEANRKSYRAAIRAFAQFKGRVAKLCEAACAHPAKVHLHVHCDLNGAVDIRALLKDVGLSLEGGGATSSREQLSPEQLRSLYSASDVLLQLSRAEGFGLPVLEAQACGTPVIVNGATAMAENVLLGKVISAVTPKQSQSVASRGDRPGSWTAPDGSAAVEALVELWQAPPSPVERNRARVSLQSYFAPERTARQIGQILQDVVASSGAAQGHQATETSQHVHNSSDPEPSVTPTNVPFCNEDFLAAEACWLEQGGSCEVLEESLRTCFNRSWQQPTLPKEQPGIHRLISTRHGPMLYNVHDTVVGRTLELCGEWLGLENAIHRSLQAGPMRVLEAGAHIGALTIPLARNGRVLALEPSRINMQLLNANLALAQLFHVDTFQAALGATAHVTSQADEVTETAQRSFRDFRVRAARSGQERRLQVVTVDQLLGHVDRLDLLRLGVAATAGAGLAPAIQGAPKSLERFRPWILAELPHGPLEGVQGEQDLRASLASHQYDCMRCDLPAADSAGAPWPECKASSTGKVALLFCSHQARIREDAWSSVSQICAR
ncbi:unnamed protein product [Effrenium voratum]|nr:unnamed protein product [Effrenium voratum]